MQGLVEWLPSIRNQLWAAFSTSCECKELNMRALSYFLQKVIVCLRDLGGCVVLLREKILSIVAHLTNTHEFPGNEKYTRCPHGEIDRDWLEKGSKVKS